MTSSKLFNSNLQNPKAWSKSLFSLNNIFIFSSIVKIYRETQSRNHQGLFLSRDRRVHLGLMKVKEGILLSHIIPIGEKRVFQNIKRGLRIYKREYIHSLKKDRKHPCKWQCSVHWGTKASLKSYWGVSCVFRDKKKKYNSRGLSDKCFFYEM